MNAQLHHRPRVCAGLAICLSAFVCAAPPTADAAPPSAAPRCPACVVAAPVLIDLAGAAVIGAAAGEAIDHATQAVDDAEAVHTGVRVANHPHAFRPWIRWATGSMRSGRAVWRSFKGKPVRIYRWLRRSYTLKKLKNKLPRAAVACVISGTITGLHTRSVEKAGWSCLGAALGALSATKRTPAANAFA